MKRLGLIVNPVAGMGGRVGLKGSDGEDTQRRARELGAEESSPKRAVEALKRLKTIAGDFELITYPSEMGEQEAKAVGLIPKVIGEIEAGATTSSDTRKAAKEMAQIGVDLLLFAGGDGTARDIYEAIDSEVPVLGIPSGVKIHSGVYAVSPSAAGELTAMYLRGEATSLYDAEVMDIDEEAYRGDRLSARLYGYLRIPREESLVQGSKEASPTTEEDNMRGIAEDVVEGMDPDALYLLAPGSTVAAVAKRLGVEKTLLGVDVIQRGKIVAKDANEAELLRIIKGKQAKIVVTAIGGQGFIFGRGNQQISPAVVRAVGKDNIIVVATPTKLSTLQGRPLIVDTGDQALDADLSGYVRVTTDYGRRVVYRLRGG